jgi:hypothetical protein
VHKELEDIDIGPVWFHQVGRFANILPVRQQFCLCKMRVDLYWRMTISHRAGAPVLQDERSIKQQTLKSADIVFLA